MSDIVEELRHWASVACDSDAEVLDKAADEIERLREEIRMHVSVKEKLKDEIERLRGLLREVHYWPEHLKERVREALGDKP